MEIIFVIIIFILIAGIVISWYYIESCQHQWVLIDKGDLNRKIKDSNDKWRKYGYYTIHECANCKKLKKEKVDLI